MNTQPITGDQLAALRKLGLPEVKENNQWLMLHVKGDGVHAPASWNAKVYTNSAGSMKVVTTDMTTLVTLMDGRQQVTQTTAANNIRVISIDDSGWGFPLLGTLVGVHDSMTDTIHIGEVPVHCYQSPQFEAKEYLDEAATRAMETFDEIAAVYPISRSATLFRVCTGYVNNGIAKELSSFGFSVQRCAIGEPLQSALEKAHADYVFKHTGAAGLYYDPKDLDGRHIGRAYSEVIKWIQENNAWHLAKTGWKSFKKLRAGV